jgi:hypothetical protein
LFQLLWGNNLLFDEKVTQPLRHTSISYPPSGTMPGKRHRHLHEALLLLWEKSSVFVLT